MSTPGPTIDTTAISNIALRDTNRLVGSVAKCLAANSPWIGVLRGGVFKSGVSDTVLGSVELQAAPGDSLAQPTFTNDSQIAGTNGTAEASGKATYDYVLQSKRGTGPKVNVKQGYSAFKSSYLTAEDALRKLVTQYINADTQYNVVSQCATKVTAKAGNSLTTNLVGGTEADRNKTFNTLTIPDAQLSFKCLHSYARFLKEALFGEMFPAGDKQQQHFRFIGSSDIIEAFRNEAGVSASLIALTTGGYKLGEQGISAYSFETCPAYRGLAFGMTHRPLRFNFIGNGTVKYTNGAVDSEDGVVVPLGVPAYINPVKVVMAEDGSNTAASVTAEPTWLAAAYEVGVLFADGTFERQVPEQYIGEGSFKFAPQLHMGELEWHYIKDNDTNAWGDYGWHKYQISRAYRPLRPQHAMAFMWKRATTDLGLTAI